MTKKKTTTPKRPSVQAQIQLALRLVQDGVEEAKKYAALVKTEVVAQAETRDAARQAKHLAGVVEQMRKELAECTLAKAIDARAELGERLWRVERDAGAAITGYNNLKHITESLGVELANVRVSLCERIEALEQSERGDLVIRPDLLRCRADVDKLRGQRPERIVFHPGVLTVSLSNYLFNDVLAPMIADGAELVELTE